jgi:hypothetical protein
MLHELSPSWRATPATIALTLGVRKKPLEFPGYWGENILAWMTLDEEEESRRARITRR